MCLMHCAQQPTTCAALLMHVFTRGSRLFYNISKSATLPIQVGEGDFFFMVQVGYGRRKPKGMGQSLWGHDYLIGERHTHVNTFNLKRILLSTTSQTKPQGDSGCSLNGLTWM
jgi:hypothetical protein